MDYPNHNTEHQLHQFEICGYPIKIQIYHITKVGSDREHAQLDIAIFEQKKPAKLLSCRFFCHV